MITSIRPMTGTTGRRRVTAAPVAAVAAVAAYWALSIAAVAVNPQWNPLHRQLSEYALGRAGWLQVAAFLAEAIAYGGLVLLVRDRVGGRGGRVGLGLLAYCALAAAGVGIFVTDPMATMVTAPTVHGLLHTFFGVTGIILLPVAALLLTRGLVRRAAGRGRRILRWAAYLPLAGLALIWIPEVVGIIPVGGWPDRVLFLTYSVWLLIVIATPAAPPESPRW